MRIAVSNPDNIGDFVVRQPMLAALAAAGHHLLLIVRTHVAPLAAWAVPGAAIVQCVADPYQPGFQLDAAPDDRVIKAVTEFDPDIFVVASFQHTQLEEQLAQRLPRAKAIGFGGELFQNDKARNITHAPSINLAVQVQVGREWLESRKNELLTSAILGTSVTLSPPRLTPEKGFLSIASGRLRQEGLAKRKFWIVCAGEGSAYTRLKNWPLEKWAEVCSAMVRDHGLHLIFVGTPSEHESTAAIRSQMGALAEKTLDMTAKPDGLDMLVGLTHFAEGYLGKDTGPMHIAAALGKPVVAVFGGGHWPRFLPTPVAGKVLSVQVPCSDCNWTCPYKTSYCVKNIPVDEVLGAVRAVIGGSPKEFEVSLLEMEPWVARAMVLDAAGTARDSMHALEVERANFHQWHDDRVRDIEGLRRDLARVETEKASLAGQCDEFAHQRDEFAHQRDELAGQRDEFARQRDELAGQRDEFARQRDEFARQRDELARQRDELAGQRDEFARQRDELAGQRDEFARQRDELAGQRDEFARQRDELAGAVAQLQSAAASSDAAVARLESAVTGSAAAALELRNNLALRDQDLARLNGHAAALEVDRANLQSLLAQRDADIVRLTEKATVAAAQAEIFRKQSDSVAESAAMQASRFAEIQGQLLAAQAGDAALRQQLGSANDEVARLSALANSTNVRLSAALAECSTLREANQRLDEECGERAAALDAALSSLDKVESRYQGTIADLRQQLRRCQEELTSVLLLVPDLRDELARCLAEVARIPAIERDQAEKQALIGKLTDTLEFVEIDRADRLDVINSLSAKLAAVEADSANRLEIIHTLSSRLAEVEADQRAKQAVIDYLAPALEDAKAALEQHHGLLVKAQKEISSTTAVVSQQKQQIAEIEADRAARLQLIERLTAQLAALEADRADRGRQIEQLHAHIEHQQAEMAKIEASLLPRRLVNLAKRS